MPTSVMNWIENVALTVRSNQCLIWPFSLDGPGYGQMIVGGRKVRASRYVCERAHGKCPTGKECAHSCGVRVCVNKRHLRWATRSENMADKIIHGTVNRGCRNGQCKLSKSEVTAIRRAKGTLDVLAARFGVSRSHIGAIKNRKKWAWL